MKVTLFAASLLVVIGLVGVKTQTPSQAQATQTPSQPRAQTPGQPQATLDQYCASCHNPNFFGPTATPSMRESVCR